MGDKFNARPLTRFRTVFRQRSSAMNRQGIISLAILLILIMLSIFAPQIAPYYPLYAGDNSLQLPSADHILGTDQIGRDVFSRLLFGGRLTFGIAALALLVITIPGTLIGMVAGYSGEIVDRLLVVVLDALLAFPALLLALAILAIAGRGILQIALAVGIAGMPSYARVVRAKTKELRSRPYIEAAHAVGANAGWILTRHLLPTMLRTLISLGTVSLSWAILNAAMLAYLGFVGDPSSPEWGAMLASARSTFRVAPWTGIAPGLTIMVTLLCVNLLADAITQRQKG